MPINELRSIATFARAAELGSLRKAAAAQGLTPQAASQALAQLELHLGVRLFHRTTRNLSLTDEGRQFLEAAQPALIGLQRALHAARQAKDDSRARCASSARARRLRRCCGRCSTSSAGCIRKCSPTFVYYGSRNAQPTRARAFIDLVVKRLLDNTDYVLGAKELQAAEARGRKAHAQRRP